MSIPIGAKIVIHHTRGGIVCLPITPEAGVLPTDVDVPQISSCKIMPEEPNYFYLTYIPGANNDTCCIDVTTGAYATTPGAGTTTAKQTATIKVKKVRFLAANTTYYVEVWGMRNGKYSSTAAQITITSGANVTPPGPGPEPEPLTRWAMQIVEIIHGSHGDPAYDDYAIGTGDWQYQDDLGNGRYTYLGFGGSLTVQFECALATSSRIDIYESSLTSGCEVYSFDPRSHPTYTFTTVGGEQMYVEILDGDRLRITMTNTYTWDGRHGNIPCNFGGFYAAP